MPGADSTALGHSINFPTSMPAARHDELGANTPASLSNGKRGGGINAEIRAKNAIGSRTRWVAPLRRGLRNR